MTNSDAQIKENSMEGYLHDCRLKMGESIREIREKKGYNQEQLAEIMKVSRTTISKIEIPESFVIWKWGFIQRFN